LAVPLLTICSSRPNVRSCVLTCCVMFLPSTHKISPSHSPTNPRAVAYTSHLHCTWPLDLLKYINGIGEQQYGGEKAATLTALLDVHFWFCYRLTWHT
jgi:hypothetical protein